MARSKRLFPAPDGPDSATHSPPEMARVAGSSPGRRSRLNASAGGAAPVSANRIS